MVEVHTELLIAKQMRASNEGLKTMHNVYDQLSDQLIECLKIAMTFGITSASFFVPKIGEKLPKIYSDSRMAE